MARTRCKAIFGNKLLGAADQNGGGGGENERFTSPSPSFKTPWAMDCSMGLARRMAPGFTQQTVQPSHRYVIFRYRVRGGIVERAQNRRRCGEGGHEAVERKISSSTCIRFSAGAPRRENQILRSPGLARVRQCGLARTDLVGGGTAEEIRLGPQFGQWRRADGGYRPRGSRS